MTIPAYPLQWPAGWKRTTLDASTRARFGKSQNTYGSYTSRGELSVAQATDRVMGELRRMGVPDYSLIISSNVQLRRDGLPRSGQRDPEDPGVAVYWRDGTHEGWPMRCMAIDRYDRVADNLAAVAATLDAMRAIERHGGAAILDRAFTGFVALEHQASDWWDVLGWPSRAAVAQAAAALAKSSMVPPARCEEGLVLDRYRKLRAKSHPDRGGDAAAFDAIQTAWADFCRERGLPP